MKILWKGYVGKLHSWSIIAQNICRHLIERGHDVHIFSTNGVRHLPSDLKDHLIGFSQENSIRLESGHLPDSKYDCQLSYTSMKNFADYLNHGRQNRFGIWCYEFAGKNALPNGFAKYYRFCDKLIPPSEFAKQVFLDSNIPESHMQVIPHGIDLDSFKNCQPYNLELNESTFKIFCNSHQPHIRKNVEGALEAFGKAFTKKDDVCLILKVEDKTPIQPFEVSFSQIFKAFKEKHKNHAQIKIINTFVPDIESLYLATDVLFSMTRAECFFMPALEALAADKINIVPRYGGQLDFLNDLNSLLIEGKIVQAPPKALYWQSRRGLTYFEPSIDDAVNKLQYCYQNHQALRNKLLQDKEFIKKYEWSNVTNQITSLIK